ncbi:MAG: PEP/pyruvate-binding domain-containing protein [Bacillota bacterium]|nr:PEP/pyruvate-binding domain-containing protein [Bacillota bacterium]
MPVVPLETVAADLSRCGSGQEMSRLRVRFGGKALGLAALAAAGLPVPEAVLLESELFSETLAHDATLSSLAPAAETAVRAAWEHMRRRGRRLLAVRSSGAVEDLEGASFAGQAETVLGVTSLEALRCAVLSCYRSACGPRAQAYLVAVQGGAENAPEARGAPEAREASAARGPESPAAPPMAVIVQAQIRPEVAGVLFTADPRSGERALLINASYGAGEVLVSGLVSPDAYALAPLPTGPVIRGRRLGTKATAVRFDRRGRRLARQVSVRARQRFCLSDREIIALADGAARIAAAAGRPQDVEFAAARGKVWFLQSRPLTALPPEPGPTAGVMGNAGGLPDPWGYNDSLSGDFLWTNVNIGEGLPGVLTPFSWGLVRVFFDRAARQVFGVLAEGVPLFGNVFGRLYLNLSGRASVVRSVAWVLPGPLFEKLAKTAWEDIWGLVPDGLGLPLVPVSPVATYARLPRSAFLFARALWRHQTRFRRFRARSAGDVRMLRERLAGATDPGALADLWAAEIEPRLLLAGMMVMFTAAATAASQKQLVLSRPLLRYGDEASMSRIMAGVGGLESVAPTLELWELSRVATASPAIVDLLQAGEPDGRLADGGFVGRVRASSGGEQFAAKLAGFLDRHGHRSDTEFEAASPGWAEDPSPVLAALRLYLQLPEAEGPVAAQAARVSEARAELARIRSRAGWRAGTIARQMVQIHHANLLRREEARSLLVLWASLGRPFALAAGRLLAERGCLSHDEQVFHLELGEVLAALRGAGRPGAAGWAYVAARRGERYRFYGKLPDPPSVFRGQVLADALGRPDGGTRDPGRHRDELGRTVLRGLPASPGRVRGLVRRLDSPRQAGLVRRGDILVTRSANVGWTIIFQTLGAVVTDVGAPFSHAAIVIRELHRPAVVDTKRATAVLGDGDLVLVDGDRGLVTRLLRRRLRRRGQRRGRTQRQSEQAGQVGQAGQAGQEAASEPGAGWVRFGRARRTARSRSGGI